MNTMYEKATKKKSKIHSAKTQEENPTLPIWIQLQLPKHNLLPKIIHPLHRVLLTLSPLHPSALNLTYDRLTCTFLIPLRDKALKHVSALDASMINHQGRPCEKGGRVICQSIDVKMGREEIRLRESDWRP